MLETQQAAPDFTTVNQAQTPITLSDLLSKQKVLLYFYPKDDTPGCTIEANDFTAQADAFAAANTRILGVSKDDCASHQAFIDKFGLKIDLLADTDGKLCEAYQVWQLKEKNGVQKMGIVRSTFLIDLEGNLAYVEYGVKPEGHAEKMLEIARSI